MFRPYNKIVVRHEYQKYTRGEFFLIQKNYQKDCNMWYALAIKNILSEIVAIDSILLYLSANASRRDAQS
jgi:hypothetical protein